MRYTSSRVMLSVIAGVLALGTGLAVMLLTGFFIPALDDSMFGDRKSIKVEFFRDSSKLKTEDIWVEVTVPGAVRVDSDAAVDFTIADVTDVLPPGSYGALLESSGAVEIRTTSPCRLVPQTVIVGVSSSASCQERLISASGASRFRWFVRSTKPGESYLTVKWPPQIGETISRKRQWIGHLRQNGKLIMEPLSSGSSSGFPARDSDIPETVSAKVPTYRRGYGEVDCVAQQFTLPIRFQTTLGVSAATYSNLSVLGTILSALLGGGWLWQVIAWLNSRKKARALARYETKRPDRQRDDQQDRRD
jgi:hypothetical protein